jgi:hypothetical protein
MMKDEFLANVGSTWGELEQVLAKLSEAQMLLRGEYGEWTGKDTLAHVTWYENEMVGILETRTFGGSELWELPLQERNAAIFAAARDKPLKEVVTAFHTVHQRLVSLLETLSEADLADPRRFAGMPLDWQPWQVIASNTYEHYPEHAQQIRKIIEQAKSGL